MHSLFGVENPLMDVIGHVDHAFLQRFHKSPGTMHLVEYSEVEALLAELGPCRTSPGGSAANTTRGVAWLASPAGRELRQSVLGVQPAQSGPLDAPVFNGAVGRDSRAQAFSAGLAEAGVRAALVNKDTPTGTSVILVTPDGERTMNTFLGACRDFRPEDLDLEALGASRMLYLTGYLWDTDNQRRAADRAAELARSKSIPIAFDLADPFAARRYSEQFRSWLPGRADVLFGNRDELSLLTGASCDEDCLSDAAALAPLVVMKTGAKGCIVRWDGRLESVPGLRVNVVDTTGAGDAFAAGFLFARLQGASPVDCARLANALAARVVQAEGCSYDS